MGRRQTVRHRRNYRPNPLPKEFNCPFCNYNQCVEVFIFRKKKEALIKSRVCHVKYSTSVSPIMENADLYCLWLDECEKVNKKLFQVKIDYQKF